MWNNFGEEKSASFEVGRGGDFEPLPDGTEAIAEIEECKWEDGHEGARHISAKWRIVDGKFTRRVIFQKMRVNDSSDKKKKSAMGMLQAIDANAGGTLSAAIKKRKGEPTNEDLSCLRGTVALIRVGLWEMNGKNGNWVSAIMEAQQAPKEAPAPTGFDYDDIPF